FFINGSEWVPGTPCTDPITHDRTPPDATTLRFFRINSADMTSLVAWQNRFQTDPLLSNFKLTLAFNGVGTTGNIDWTSLPTAGVANDNLTSNVQNYQKYFHWISHTYDHPNTLNGLHKSDPGGDPDTPQVDSIDLEILTNQYVATGAGQNLDQDPSDSVNPLHLTDFNPANLVTPGVTGLNDTLVPTYLVQDGIRYVVTDTSVIGQANNGPNPSPNVGMVNSYAPSLYEVRSEEHTSELQSRGHLVYLHSFPTRRSSDLSNRLQPGEPRYSGRHGSERYFSSHLSGSRWHPLRGDRHLGHRTGQ